MRAFWTFQLQRCCIITFCRCFSEVPDITTLSLYLSLFKYSSLPLPLLLSFFFLLSLSSLSLNARVIAQNLVIKYVICVQFWEMSSASGNHSGEGRNGCRWLRFEYEKCWCRERASLKIVADARRESYGMLYFVCENKGKVGGCNYFRWCYPKSTDVNCVGQLRREDVEVEGEEVESEHLLRNCGAAVGWKWKDFFVLSVACCSLVIAILAMVISLVG